MQSIDSQFAKQSLTESQNEPNEQSSLSASSNNQPNHPWLEDLLIPIFVVVCSFLTLDEKCASLLSLSKSMKHKIKQSISQFHTGYLSVQYRDGEDQELSQTNVGLLNIKRAGRINYLQYASRVHVEIKCPLPGQRRKNLLLSLKKSLISGILLELSIVEHLRTKVSTITSELLQELGKPNVKLEKLYIDLFDLRAVHDDGYWSGLKKCNTLKYLRVGLDDQISSTASLRETAPYLMSHDLLYQAIPDSVETVVIESYLPVNHLSLIWRQNLADDKILPNLRAFTVREISTKGVFGVLTMLKIITDTKMRATGKIRPIDSWSGDMDDLPKVRQLDLTDLAVAGCTPQIFEEMSKPDTKIWPNLRRVNAIIVNRPNGCDILPILKLASLRSVHKFQYLHDNPDPRLALDHQCIRIMASMSQLEILRLKGTSHAPMFAHRDFTDLIPIGAWPKLRSIDIYLPDMSESQLSNILAGCPNATYVAVELSQRSLSHSLLLAMILHFCPFVKRIIMNAVNETETIKEAQNSFKRYPPPVDGPKHLVALEVPSTIKSDSVLHYLIRQVCCSPMLQYFTVTSVNTSPLTLCMTRAFPHLRCLDQLRAYRADDVHPTVRNLDCSALEQCFEFRLASAASTPLENMRYSINSSVMRFAECYEDVIADLFGTIACYPAFKSCMPGTSQSGRERFYELLFDLLSDSDKSKLIAFDKGEYGTTTGKRR